ncbi:MAG: hypothetical protein LBP26_05975 [Clostridiales bacterium]|jgi:pyruvate,water dikinase|nr:hypothetical protein [Clostridiales bacterium]
MKIYGLNELPRELYGAVGGKARGLAGLIRAGLTVAPGFVITEPDGDADFEAAADYFERSGLERVAVRSSATAEDGADFSSAGQYATTLNVSGREAFIRAARACVDSLRGVTSRAYSGFFAAAASASMNIVVQKMVDAVTAGVVFTADPLTREKKLIIEAVAGLGESLVSGAAAAERYAVEYGENGTGKIEAGGKLLSEAAARAIADESLKAKAYFNSELDLEWAADKSGRIVFLQARPVTTLCDATIDEFDSKIGDGNTVFTTCNIGEMLPGAVTPLSLTTSVLSIDAGLRKMLFKAGCFKKLPPNACVTSFSNHLFFNLTTIYKMATSIVGAAKSDVEASICGKKLDTPPPPWKKSAAPIRLINSVKYMRFLFSRKKAMKKIEKAVNLSIPRSDDMSEYYGNIDAALKELDAATYLHYITSAHSGAMSSVLLTVFMSEGMSEPDARELLSGLLEDIDGIESVDILRSMRRVAARVLAAEPAAASFTPARLLEFLENSDGEVKEAYSAFLTRHGHRAIREAELRSRSWKNDGTALAENILTVVKSGAVEPQKAKSQADGFRAKALANRKGIGRKIIGYIIDQARAGVYNREYTKSCFVRVVDRFKEAYADLAAMLTAAGALPDADAVYFLTHAEIGGLIRGKSPALVKKALQRRRLLDEQKQLKFNDLYIGFPKAVSAAELASSGGRSLTGAPISRGEAVGRARVVRTVEDAKLLQNGEIMIAAFTDIGWSPYYSVIKGLVTEVGSALSHGAVVAREYALPLVVNVKNATGIIKTGDLISLNGGKGTVTIVEPSK